MRTVAVSERPPEPQALLARRPALGRGSRYDEVGQGRYHDVSMATLEAEIAWPGA